MSLGDHNHGTQIELDNVRALACCDRNLDGIVDLDIRVGVSEGASVVRDGAGDLVGTHVDLVDSAQLVLGLFSVETVQDVTSLCVEQQTEAIVRLFHLDDVHETSGVAVVRADLAVDLDATFHANLLALLARQGVLETFAEDDGKGQALAEFVRAGGGSGRPDPSHLTDIPVLRRMEALQMLFRSTSPASPRFQPKTRGNTHSTGELMDGLGHIMVGSRITDSKQESQTSNNGNHQSFYWCVLTALFKVDLHFALFFGVGQTWKCQRQQVKRVVATRRCWNPGRATEVDLGRLDACSDSRKKARGNVVKMCFTAFLVDLVLRSVFVRCLAICPFQ